MVKSFLPILKDQAINKTYGHARILNMVSMAGVLAASGLGMSPYEASKAAAESFTESLRLELKDFGIKVVALNPSFHKTPLIANVSDKIKAEVWDKMDATLKEEYGTGMFECKFAHGCT